MGERQPKKLIILYILKILEKYSDANHRLSQSDILDKLKSDYNMVISRKSIRPNILELIEIGYDIEYTEKSRSANDVVLTDFYLNKEFTDEELRIIIDSLLFSKYIPSNQCKKLVNKIENLSSIYFKYKIKHINNMPERYPKNNEVFYTIGVLDKAIEDKVCVKFQYKDFDTSKKLKTRMTKDNTPKEYVVSPYQMVATNSRYYLIGNYNGFDNISYYRIDRISNIKLTDVPVKPLNQVKNCENGFDLPQHMAEHIYMFSGESGTVVFRAKKNIINHIIDWFGTGVNFFNEDEEEVSVSVTVNYVAMKYWSMQYANYIKVLSPQCLVDEIKNDLKAAIEKYA